MSTITLPAKANEHPNIRALNVLRDLSTVADLIELCFANTMDNDGQRYLSDMRRASRDSGFLRWADHVAETTSLPLTGYVWEENNKIVGNAMAFIGALTSAKPSTAKGTYLKSVTICSTMGPGVSVSPEID